MGNKRYLLLTLFTLLIKTQVVAQAPNYTGTWVLNFNKSQLESRPEGLTSSVFIIKEDGDKFRLTRYHISGEKRSKIRFRMVADGKVKRVKLLFKGKLERKENTLQATLWGMGILNIVNYKFGNSQDEFIADEVFTGKPKNHHNIWVFDRESSKP